MPEPVDPAGARRVGARERPRDRAAHHHRAQAELADRVLELGDGLFGRERRDARDRQDPVAVRRVHLGDVDVERARQCGPQLVVGEVDRGEPVRRVGDRDVDADLVEPLVQQLREHRGRAVERVARRDPPPRDTHERQLAPLRGREHCVSRPLSTTRSKRSATDAPRELDEDVAHERQVLDDVPVAVDDRMVDPVADLGDLGAAFVRSCHGVDEETLVTPDVLDT